MSTLAGICYSDHRPITRSDHGCVLRALAAPPETIRFYEAPGLVLAYAGPENGFFEVDLEGRGRVICAFDGRLDNRRELSEGARATDIRGHSDASLALSAYVLDGIAGLHRLVGDWSLAIFDERQREVVLASDYAGVRPLYYRRQTGDLTWSSCLASLAGRRAVSEIDNSYVAEFLTRGPVQHLTPYPGVSTVPAGSAIAAGDGSFRIERFWHLPASQTLRYSSDSEYEEHFRSLFRDAVRTRLNKDGPVSAELSGGLDSSSVVSMASRLVETGDVSAAPVLTFSYTAPSLTDESFYTAIERIFPVRPNHLDVRQYSFLSRDSAGGAAPAWWVSRNTAVAERMAEYGSRVLLTGRPGDLIMANWDDDSEQAADCLVGGRALDTFREALAWSHSLRLPVYPFLWRAARGAMGYYPPAALPRCDDSLTAAIRRLVEERSPRMPAWWRSATPARRKRLLALNELLETRSLQCPEALMNISCSHPFAHRPLVEFMMKIPPAIACRPGEPRRLMRRALAGIVPDAVLLRRSKSAYDGVFIDALRPLTFEMLKNIHALSLVQREIIDPASIRHRLTRLVNGLPCDEPQLRQVILLEFWLRTFERRSLPECFPPNGSAVPAITRQNTSTCCFSRR